MALKLPRFQRTLPLVEDTRVGSIAFHQWWNESATAIEAATEATDTAVADLTTTQAALTATQADLAAAVADIAAAQAAITTAQSDIAALETGFVAVVIQDATPLWQTPTGTLTRTTFATYSAPTISATPTQSEVQAIADHVQALSQRIAALVTDLRGNGVLQ